MLAVSDPREGLPPCLSVAVFDGRMAAMVDGEADSSCDHYSARFWVGAGTIIRREKALTLHGFYPWVTKGGFELFTDDPDEAQAAFAKGAEWVRTGEMA